MADEGIQVKVFKTGDFVLCKWECHECDADDEGKESEENSEKWLPARLGKCSDNGKWDVFWLTRKDRVLVSELIDGEPSMSHGVVQSDLRPIDERKTTVLKAKGVRGGGSACWAYFTEPVHKDTLKRITYCCVQNEKGEQCSQALNVTAASTGSMINHLSAKHGICLQQGLSSSASSSAASSKSVRQEKCDELFSKSYARESTAWKSKFSALCKFLTTDMRPINLAQGKGFKEFCAVMDPRFCIPNAITINAQILREYTAMKERVCKALQLECPSNIHDQKMVSTTIDCWSRLDQKGFFGVTAHWITEDFHMRSVTLAAAALEVLHNDKDEVVHEDADTIIVFLRNILSSFGVKAFSMTADGPTVMDKVRRVLYDEDNTFGLRCLAHILHKAIGHSLETDGVKEPVAVLSEGVNHIKKSNIASQELALMVRKLELKSTLHPDQPAPEKLVVNVKWRWGYSSKMIHRYLELKPACDMLQDSEQWGFNVLSLTHSDKHLLEQIESYLAPIAKQIFSVEGEHYVTLSTAMPKVKYLLEKALLPIPSDAQCIAIAKAVCKDDIYQRYVSLYMDTNDLDDLTHGLLFAAAYLDPRFKSFEPFINVSDRKDSITFAEKNIKLYHKSLLQRDQVLPTESCIAEPLSKRAKHVSSADDDFATFMSTSYQGEGSSSSGTSKVDASRDLTKELAQYSKIAAQPLKDDPLDWWRVERKRFPELAKVARVVLATPATSAPTERVFSKLGRVCARERAHMNPIMADAITFLASNRTWK